MVGVLSARLATMQKVLILAVVLSAAVAAPLGLGGAHPAARDNSAPTEAEQRALLDKVFAHQHANDAALEYFERVERRLSRTNDGSNRVETLKRIRVVPTGTGNALITLEDQGRAADPAAIRNQMDQLAKTLATSMDASNAETKRLRERLARRARDRSELIDAIRQAFVFTWMGREERDGRTLVKFHLDPNPAYKAPSRTTEMFRHAVATMWVDESAAQVARLDAEISSDISFLGGIAGKIYHGGHFFIAQAEVEPGVWLPTYSQTDLTARRLFTTSEYHLVTEAGHYRRIGPPEQALAAIRREMASAANPTRQ